MVERANLAEAEALDRESRTIKDALSIFEAGGRINGMLIGDDRSAQQQPAPAASRMHDEPEPPSLPEPPRQTLGNVMVMTETWVYPSQMVESIKQQLQARQAEIDKKLAELGVT